MELQVRIAYETAEMLELLKEHYQKQNGINFTKGEVLSKAILDTYIDWKKIDWSKTLSLPIKIEKNTILILVHKDPNFNYQIV